ncbi:MAG: hypothetical protein JO033_19455 [Acidobacteriaceae bacterium]|nr:hypothetical protein [Acidobacteriaceae bacterium]
MDRTETMFFPSSRDRASAIGAGLHFGQAGTHLSRTMMLTELTALLAAVPANGKAQEYASSVIEENCLGKQTAANRRHSLQHLRELYALDPTVSLFRILRRLWEVDVSSRALLALLASLARDPLLRATAEVIVGMPDGTELQRASMREHLFGIVRDGMNASTLDKVVRNAASSWSQSGHLEGRTFKFRRLVRPTPACISYGLYLARAAGLTIENSLSSGWIKILDCSRSGALDLAGAAKRLGLIDLRMAGDVIDLNLNRLDPAFQSSSQAKVTHGAH